MNEADGLLPGESLAAALRRLKAESGLSFGRLAARTNYSASALERYLNGKALPPRQAVEVVAEVCGGDVGSLLTLLEQANQRHRGQIPRRESGGGHVPSPHSPSRLQVECERLARVVVNRESRARHDLLRGFAAPSVTFEVAGFWRGGAPQTAGFGEEGGRAGGDSSSIGAFFSDLPCRRLIIVGEPDSGKTLLAIELVLQLAAPLVDPAQESPPVPLVPLRLPAASGWRPGLGVDVSLIDYLIEELNAEPGTAAELVAARHVLPVVDGLDLLDTDLPATGGNAAAIVAELDCWADVTGRRAGAVVVTCAEKRVRQLERLDVSLNGATKIRVRPLRTTQIHRYLQQKIPDGHSAAAVREAMLKVFAAAKATGDGAALRRPWRLLLLGAAIDAHTLPSNAGETNSPALPSDQELLHVQINLALRTAAEAGRPNYDPDRVRTWMLNIAAHLHRDGTDTIHPHLLGRMAGPWRFALTLLTLALTLGAITGTAVTVAEGTAMGSPAALAAAGAVVLGGLCAPPARCRIGLLAAFCGRLLPLRVDRFLRWCCNAGLVRGTASVYQFRHQGLGVPTPEPTVKRSSPTDSL